jgi:cytochrome P450
MEFFVALIALLFCLAVFRSSYNRRARTPAAVQQIGDPTIAHRALVQNADAFSSKPPGLFPVPLNLSSLPYGPHWRALRCNLTAGTLHPTHLGDLAPLQLEAIQAIITGFSGQAPGEVVVRDHLYPAVFALVSRVCFGDGVEEDHVNAMQRLLQEFVATAGELNGIFLGTRLARFVHRRRLQHLLSFRVRQAELYLPLIAARRESRFYDGGVRRPYVDSLIDLRVPNGDDTGSSRRALRDDEMVSIVSEFLGGGTDTIVAIIEWTLAHLVTQPEVQNKLRRELDCSSEDTVSEKSFRDMPYLHAVVLESLRMHPSVPFLPRRVRAEDAAVLGETTLPAGDFTVQFLVGDVGRDPKTWSNPDEFLPERFLTGGEAEGVGPSPGPKEIKMMPFGAGHRFCPGMNLAMVNIKCILAALVRKFEWELPAQGCRGVDMTDLNLFFKVMKKPLSARVTRRADTN